MAVLHGDRIQHLRGFGVADDTRRPVTERTPFVLGPLTKSLPSGTSACLARKFVQHISNVRVVREHFRQLTPDRLVQTSAGVARSALAGVAKRTIGQPRSRYERPTASTYTAAIAPVSHVTTKRFFMTLYVSPMRNNAFIMTIATIVTL